MSFFHIAALVLIAWLSLDALILLGWAALVKRGRS